jgi:uncharacterized protein (DUF433 family)
MESGTTWDYGIAPRYSLADAARILLVPKATLRTWSVGWSRAKSRRAQPSVIQPDGGQTESTCLSFFNLVEAGFLNAYREAGAPMQRVRAALDYCRSHLEIARPLLTERFRIDGRDLVLEFDRRLLNASASGQLIWPEAVDRWLREIDYDRLGPFQVWIAGREKSILVNPRVGFGYPVLATCGVRTEEVLERFLADERPEEIAEDFGAKVEEVLEAIRWETTRLAA